MSGGSFDYKQYQIGYIADAIEQEVYDNVSEEKKQDEYVPIYSDKTIKEFKEAVALLRKAVIYAQRIDWLLAGDDGEDTFHTRLKKDLEKLT